MTLQPVALPSYRDIVRAEWVDYNGHMRDAFYMLVFSYATDALLDLIGLDAAARSARERSVYTLEAHLLYLRETRQGAALRVETRLVAHDAKRLHLYLEMFADPQHAPVAASEQMMLHVDTRGPRAAEFDSDVKLRLDALAAAAAALAPPAYTGRVIGLSRGR
ncbi:MAG TPA: thioesterase family protein [Paraburkholderia sp.]|jgi:acyl-CoA thioester hydrolase|nr:thioesterase family protein [Paraburkholderia sp.]